MYSRPSRHGGQRSVPIHPACPRSPTGGTSPSEWFDEHAERWLDELLRGSVPRTRPTADLQRFRVLETLVSWSFHGEPLAWRRIPSLTLLLRHPDAALTGKAVRVVGHLAANPEVSAEDRPWERWVEYMTLAATDQRVLVRMAVAWTVARAHRGLPPNVLAAVTSLRQELEGDDRAGVQAALRGW